MVSSYAVTTNQKRCYKAMVVELWFTSNECFKTG